MSGPAPARPRKITIIGGGMAGLAAAWRLSHAAAEPGRAPAEITVYEQSWQLGGKGASGRGVHGRIEEHGLHVWLGYYENAFQLIREVYAELDRVQTAPECPIRTWRDGFAPAGRVGVEEKTGPGWQHWVATFRATSGEPGDADAVGGTAAPAEFLRRAVGLLADFSTSLLEMRAADRAAGAPAAAGTVVLSGSPRPPRPARTPLGSEAFGGEVFGRDLAGLLQQARFAAVIATIEGIRLVGESVPPGMFAALTEQLDRMRVDLDVVVSHGDPSLRRLGELADLVVSCCLGIVGDRLLTDPRGFGAIDDLDFRDWLRRHGARPQTLDSALVRGMYDLVFAYRDGDRTQPRFCAGLGLFLAGKFFFDYRGSLFWHLQAGMGDIVFAPMYEALRARGVRFEFFHRLDRLVLDPDRQRIEALRLTRTRTVTAAAYAPLITVGGLPCFTAAPDETQLAPLASSAATGGTGAELVELRAGDDFDTVVLAASIGSLPEPCAELIDHSARWRSMITDVVTVATQSLQLWLRPSEADLGWNFPASTISGYVPPFDTYASMTHLLAKEQWPGEHQPATLGYFCGSLQLPEPDADPVEVATANAVRFLDRHAGHFWPAATGPAGFRWELLADGGSPVDPDHPLAGQYVRANVTGSERYVQSMPGSQRSRLRVDESGYPNLVLAGDWTNSGLNAGCVEAAVLSGLEAANVVLGRPLMSNISGSWYGVGP
ncbi:MAG: FAD-dependent oxidoreductase [Microlunatus sp.]